VFGVYWLNLVQPIEFSYSKRLNSAYGVLLNEFWPMGSFGTKNENLTLKLRLALGALLLDAG
jgi:hypothetical protein